MPEKWRRIPGSTGRISTRGNVKNRHGAVLTPLIFPANKNWMKRAGYRFRDRGRSTIVYPQIIMPRVWPEIEPEIFDKRWALAVREQRRMSRPITSDASGVTWRGGEVKDPWDSMSLWDVERESFSWAQYCPCL
jgi:hypothetical protein